MSVVSNNILAGASGQGGGGYEIERSLRFNSGDSAKLTRTPSSAGNRKTWTWSGWVKRSSSGWLLAIGNDKEAIYFKAEGNLVSSRYDGGFQYYVETTPVFNDYSAWYHIVVAHDTTLTTASDRVKIYINGTRITEFNSGTSYPSQNAEFEVNDTTVHEVGKYFNGYLADIHFIDGQALAPTDFGETDDNGVWQPKKFDGSYNYTPTITYPAVYTSSPGVYGTVAGINSSSGVFSTTSSTGSGSIKVEFSPAISNVTHIKFNGGGYSVNAVFDIKVNGTVTHSGLTTNSSYAVRTETISSTNITSFEIVSASDGWALGDLQFSTDGSTFASPTGTPAVFVPGVNGFHLDFADNSSDAALGTDTSGNSNTWTVNNLVAQTVNGVNYYNMLNVTPNVGNAFIASNVTPYVNTSTWAITDVHWIGMSYYSGTGAMTFTPTTSIPVTNSLIVYFGAWADSAYTTALTITYTDSTTETSSFTSSSQNYMGVKTASNASGKSIQSISVINSSGLGYHSIGGIVVDGNILESTVSVDGDSSIDTPTNGRQPDTGAGGEVVGNYATWNPLDKHSAVTLANGNLDISQSSSGFGKASIHVSSGKWYWEYTRTDTVASVAGIALSSVAPSATYLGGVSGTAGFDASSGAVYSSSPIAKVNNSNVGAQANGSIAGFALDCDNGTLKLYINGVLQTANHITFTPGTSVTPAFGTNGTAVAAYPTNFGQRAFAYTAPSGYKCLCTTNLPDPTIEDGSKYFDTKLFNAANGTQTVSGYNFSPDLVWTKSRANAYAHQLWDQVRGANKALSSNDTSAEANLTDSLAFTSDGFTSGTNNNANYGSGGSVAWAWDAGSSNTTIAVGGLNSSLYNQSQTWSTYGTFTGAFSGSYDWEGVFSASMQYDADGAMYLSTAPAKWTLTSSIPCNSSVKFYLYGTTSFTINQGLSDEVTQTSTGGNTFHYLTIPFSGNISNIQVNTASQYLIRIYVDDAALIDAGISLGSGDVPNVPTIASTVRANPSAGFSIVSFTGDGSSHTVGHGLNTIPEMIILKDRDNATNWLVYTQQIDGSFDYLKLNLVDAKSDSSYSAPTSTVFSYGTDAADYIAYCFAPVEGYSAMGSFEATNTVEGPFVYTGFRPRFLLIKNADDTQYASSYSWVMIDTERYPNNTAAGSLNPLYANRSAEENLYGPGSGAADQLSLDILSNGFKPRCANAELNVGGTYIYYAVAENSFKTARAR